MCRCVCDVCGTMDHGSMELDMHVCICAYHSGCMSRYVYR